MSILMEKLSLNSEVQLFPSYMALPLPCANGMPKSIEDFSKEELEAFVTFMNLRSSQAEGRHVWMQPLWWPSDTPYSPTCPNLRDAKSLRRLVRKCYTYHKSLRILDAAAALASIPVVLLFFESACNDTYLIRNRKTEETYCRILRQDLMYDMETHHQVKTLACLQGGLEKLEKPGKSESPTKNIDKKETSQLGYPVIDLDPEGPDKSVLLDLLRNSEKAADLKQCGDSAVGKTKHFSQKEMDPTHPTTPQKTSQLSAPSSTPTKVKIMEPIVIEISDDEDCMIVYESFPAHQPPAASEKASSLKTSLDDSSKTGSRPPSPIIIIDDDNDLTIAAADQPSFLRSLELCSLKEAKRTAEVRQRKRKARWENGLAPFRPVMSMSSRRSLRTGQKLGGACYSARLPLTYFPGASRVDPLLRLSRGAPMAHGVIRSAEVAAAQPPGPPPSPMALLRIVHSMTARYEAACSTDPKVVRKSLEVAAKERLRDLRQLMKQLKIKPCSVRLLRLTKAV